MDNILITFLFAIIFASFDYIFYNISEKRRWIKTYRILQTIIQCVIVLIAWFCFNPLIAIGFFILWWSWACDWMFYLYAYIFNFYKERDYLSKEYFNYITWAWWTWWGLLVHKGNQTYTFKRWELVTQTVIGVVVTALLFII